MIINPERSKIMVINGHDQDRLPIVRGDCTISHCDTYVYLGAIFTADGKVCQYDEESHCK